MLDTAEPTPIITQGLTKLYLEGERELKEGDGLGTYHLLRRLGSGAFAEVWLARHAELGVDRALKIPTHPDYIRQLRLEARTTVVRHPHIVQTVDLVTAHEPPYLVMEYVDGRDLRKALNERSRFPVLEALEVLRDVLSAVSAAHANGVIHHDLKPENILIASDGTVKVTDFGLGIVQPQVTRSLLLSERLDTTDGAPVSGGTFEYMSPEQRLRMEPDPRDDIYALGIIGCELLTGSRPMRGIAIEEALAGAGIRKGVALVLKRALSPRDQRYEAAGPMFDDVRDLVAEEQRRNQQTESSPHKPIVPAQRHNTVEIATCTHPQLQVPVDAFEIGVRPVSVLEYMAFAESGIYEDPKNQDEAIVHVGVWTEEGLEWLHALPTRRPAPPQQSMSLSTRPMLGVSWYEATAYCNWLSLHEGNASGEEWAARAGHPQASMRDVGDAYRLPTEAELEIARDQLRRDLVTAPHSLEWVSDRWQPAHLRFRHRASGTVGVSLNPRRVLVDVGSRGIRRPGEPGMRDARTTFRIVRQKGTQ